MKKLLTILAACGAAFSIQAANVELVVERVDNGGAVPGNTFRVYAELPSTQHSLHAVFADDSDGLTIQSTGEFYNHPYGNYSTLDINAEIVAAQPQLGFDSWITLGAENNTNNNLWTAGVDFSNFEQGGDITVMDGAWFVVPTDVRAFPNSSNLILLAQLTTDGTASGILNFQGKDADGNVWQERGVTFSTDNAHVFGCMDQTAANFNVDVTYDDGTCEAGTDNGNADVAVSSLTDQANVTVFPNPIWEGQFNLQFSEKLDLKEDKLMVEVFDGNGKHVLAQEFGQGAVIGGNRVIIEHQLAAGNYTVNLSTASFKDAVQVIVQR